MLVTFFGLTFLAAWTLWTAAATITATSMSPGIRGLFILLGTFAPGIVAIWMTARADGRAGARALLSRVIEWDVGARWYMFAVGYMAAVKLVAAVAHRVISGAWPIFGDVPWYFLLAAVAFSTPIQAGEEIGWRGYALPRLAARLGLARAGLLLGIIWACWHLPLFLMPGTDNTGQPFLVYLLSVTALSVAMAWLFGHTRGSLLLAMLMHAAINNTKDIVPSAAPDSTNPLAQGTSLVAWLTAAVLWASAAYFLARMPRVDVSPARAAAAHERLNATAAER
jgi:membrane protease YdiL (CAAX protease family)